MEQVIDAMVNVLLTVLKVVVPPTGVLGFLAFAILWGAFAVALVSSQGSIDAAWQWVRGLPLLLQGIVWLLFLPVVIGLWVWETTWPVVLRIVLLVGIAGWNLMVFFPKALFGMR